MINKESRKKIRVKKHYRMRRQDVYKRQSAERDMDINVSKLYVQEAYANQGTTMKRIRPRAQGRADRILKKTSHITIILNER